MQSIAQQWAEFEAKVVPATAGKVQREEMRRAFYGGFASCLFTQLNIVADFPSDELAETRLQSLHEEARQFSASLDDAPDHRSREVRSMGASARLSEAGQTIAQQIANMLSNVSGEPIGYVLMFSADDIAQYVSNLRREDGQALIESLLARWKANRADIPAHYNPDLKKAKP